MGSSVDFYNFHKNTIDQNFKLKSLLLNTYIVQLYGGFAYFLHRVNAKPSSFFNGSFGELLILRLFLKEDLVYNVYRKKIISFLNLWRTLKSRLP